MGKKKQNKIKQLELVSRTKIKTFEKKPTKGGTPAIEKKIIIKIFDALLCVLNLENEWRVLNTEVRN